MTDHTRDAMLAVDVLYAERANGRIETWTYSDGRREFLWTCASMLQAERLAKRHGMRFVEVA